MRIPEIDSDSPSRREPEGEKKTTANMKLLERVLLARPDAGLEEVRRLAPGFRDLPDHELLERMKSARRHAGKRQNIAKA